jgi:hypothetical protein
MKAPHIYIVAALLMLMAAWYGIISMAIHVWKAVFPPPIEIVNGEVVCNKKAGDAFYKCVLERFPPGSYFCDVDNYLGSTGFYKQNIGDRSFIYYWCSPNFGLYCLAAEVALDETGLKVASMKRGRY